LAAPRRVRRGGRGRRAAGRARRGAPLGGRRATAFGSHVGASGRRAAGRSPARCAGRSRAAGRAAFQVPCSSTTRAGAGSDGREPWSGQRIARFGWGTVSPSSSRTRRPGGRRRVGRWQVYGLRALLLLLRALGAGGVGLAADRRRSLSAWPSKTSPCRVMRTRTSRNRRSYFSRSALGTSIQYLPGSTCPPWCHLRNLLNSFGSHSRDFCRRRREVGRADPTAWSAGPAGSATMPPLVSQPCLSAQRLVGGGRRVAGVDAAVVEHAGEGADVGDHMEAPTCASMVLAARRSRACDALAREVTGRS